MTTDTRVTRGKESPIRTLRRWLGRRLIAWRLFADTRRSTPPAAELAIPIPHAPSPTTQPYVPDAFPTNDPSPHRKLWVPTRLKKQPRTLKIYQKARLFGRNPIGMTASGHVIRETINHRRSLVELALNAEAALLRRDSRQRVVEKWPGDYMLLAGRYPNYGHWLLEHLVKVVYLQAADPDLFDRTTMIVEPEPNRWKLDTLDYLGVPLEHRRPYPRPPRIVEVERLVVPPYPEPHRAALQRVSAAFLEEAARAGVAADFGERLILSRAHYEQDQGQFRRAVNNEPELIEALAPLGFRPLSPEAHGVHEQAAIFAKAHIVIGANGSAFANIIHMPAGGHVVDLFGNRVDLYFRQLAMEMGLTHHIVYGRPIPETLSWQHGGRFLDGAFDVDVDAVRCLVEDILQASSTSAASATPGIAARDATRT